MTLAHRILQYHRTLKPDWDLPEGFDLLYPYDDPDTWTAMESFYRKYYTSGADRIFLFGINPGRFGAGVTGVPFTDPVRLEGICGIKNPFAKRLELSSEFVYTVVEAMGGPEAFFNDFYVSAICPLGFTTAGKQGNPVNANYYDDRRLESAVKPHIIRHLQDQEQLGMRHRRVVCLGEGQNFKFFQKLNAETALLEEIVPLPHPRWVMQYRRKKMQEYVDRYRVVLEGLL